VAIDVTFLREKGQQPDQAVQVAHLLADFIRAAEHSIRLAAYDFALTDEALLGPVRQALRERAAAGVEVRIAFYQKKTAFNPHDRGATTLATGTEACLKAIAEGTGIELRSIHGDDPHQADKDHLMHNKYIVRDAHTAQAAVWTGSTNFTDEAWKFMENNLVRVDSPELAAYYVNDFEELWTSGEVQSTGAFDVGHATVDPVALDVAFTP
jgi:phosphatidylserine/phosphatidylglycerophosphate/cardiolipin synthase-like enzyme